MTQPDQAWEAAPPKQGFQMPHIYVILFVFTAIAALLTHFIPAGAYQRIAFADPAGRTRKVIDPESYTLIDNANPVGFVDFMLAVPKGLVGAADVVFFTLMIGGMFMVIRRTGVIEVAVDKLTRALSGNSILMIPVLMVVFAVIATLIGTQELALVYVPVILPLMIALRFDSITALGVALLATTAGFTAGVLNPINTGLGQAIADVERFSGMGLRMAALVLILGSGMVYLMRYAARVRANPAHSLLHGDDKETDKRALYQNAVDTGALQFSTRQRLAGLATIAWFALMVWGVISKGWFMMEMAGLFVLMGVTVGLIGGLSLTRMCEAFNEGFRDVLVGAIIVGLARAVAVMLEQGQVMDTIVKGLGGFVGDFPAVLTAVGMFLAQLGFNFVVPSGSGQALVTMPIMAPLSDLIGVTRQTAVLAFQFGDGLSNILFPTSGYFMATLALAGVTWDRWVRFFLPLFGIWVAIAAGFMVFAQVTQWVG